MTKREEKKRTSIHTSIHYLKKKERLPEKEIIKSYKGRDRKIHILVVLVFFVYGRLK